MQTADLVQLWRRGEIASEQLTIAERECLWQIVLEDALESIRQQTVRHDTVSVGVAVRPDRLGPSTPQGDGDVESENTRVHAETRAHTPLPELTPLVVGCHP